MYNVQIQTKTIVRGTKYESIGTDVTAQRQCQTLNFVPSSRLESFDI